MTTNAVANSGKTAVAQKPDAMTEIASDRAAISFMEFRASQ